jgi:hypothetical protein
MALTGRCSNCGAGAGHLMLARVYVANSAIYALLAVCHWVGM